MKTGVMKLKCNHLASLHINIYDSCGIRHHNLLHSQHPYSTNIRHWAHVNTMFFIQNDLIQHVTQFMCFYLRHSNAIYNITSDGDILSVTQHKVRITFTVRYHDNENPLHGCFHFRTNSITSSEKQMPSS